MGFLDNIGKLFSGGDVDSPDRPKYDWSGADAALGQQNQARQQQGLLGGMLMQQATGNGPSVAQNQLRQAQATNAAQQSSAAASARGGAMNAMLAQKNAADLSAQSAQQTAGQAATLRAQEQLGAMGQLGNLYGQMREGDLNAANMAQARQLGLGQQQLGYGAQQMQADMANQQANQVFGKLVTGAAQGAAAGLVMSDRNVKHDIEPLSHEEIRSVAEAMRPRGFRYDEEGDRGPRRMGIIVQDLERSPAGRYMVSETEDGKAIDTGSALSYVLAAISDIYRRMDDK